MVPAIKCVFLFQNAATFRGIGGQRHGINIKSLNKYIASSYSNNLICVSGEKFTSWIRVDKKSFYTVSLLVQVRSERVSKHF